MSSNGPNWGDLVAQGRAKAVGVSWSEAELVAINELKIPVEYVRGGCCTLKEYEKETSGKKSETPKPQYLTREDLLVKAEEEGIEIADKEAITRADLILLLQQSKKKPV